MNKPRCKLIGKDGNVFNIIGLVRNALRNAGQLEQAREFVIESLSCGSYDKVLVLAKKYVEVE